MKTDSRSSVIQRWRECLRGSCGSLTTANCITYKQSGAVGANPTTIESVPLFPPTGHQLIVDPNLVKNPRDNKIDQAIERLDTVIPSGHRWENDRVVLSKAVHILKLNCTQWRLTRNQHKLSVLLQMNIRGALNQICRGCPGYATQRAPATWANHHRLGEERTAGNGCHEIIMSVIQQQSFFLTRTCHARSDERRPTRPGW